MIDLLYFVNKILALGAIASQIFIVLAIVYMILFRQRNKVTDFFSRNGIKMAFMVSVVAVSGSLFYAGYAGFVPCNLCWFQRIFMYPEVILLGLALLKKDEGIVDYVLSLSIVGAVISIYHNYIYFKSLASAFCTISEPCTVAYVTEFNYITIPMMALTAFLLITLLLIARKYYDKK